MEPWGSEDPDESQQAQSVHHGSFLKKADGAGSESFTPTRAGPPGKHGGGAVGKGSMEDVFADMELAFQDATGACREALSHVPFQDLAGHCAREDEHNNMAGGEDNGVGREPSSTLPLRGAQSSNQAVTVSAKSMLTPTGSPQDKVTFLSLAQSIHFDDDYFSQQRDAGKREQPAEDSIEACPNPEEQDQAASIEQLQAHQEDEELEEQQEDGELETQQENEELQAQQEDEECDVALQAQQQDEERKVAAPHDEQLEDWLLDAGMAGRARAGRGLQSSPPPAMSDAGLQDLDLTRDLAQDLGLELSRTEHKVDAAQNSTLDLDEAFGQAFHDREQGQDKLDQARQSAQPQQKEAPNCSGSLWDCFEELQVEAGQAEPAEHKQHSTANEENEELNPLMELQECVSPPSFSFQPSKLFPPNFLSLDPEMEEIQQPDAEENKPEIEEDISYKLEDMQQNVEEEEEDVKADVEDNLPEVEEENRRELEDMQQDVEEEEADVKAAEEDNQPEVEEENPDELEDIEQEEADVHGGKDNQRNVEENPGLCLPLTKDQSMAQEISEPSQVMSAEGNSHPDKKANAQTSPQAATFKQKDQQAAQSIEQGEQPQQQVKVCIAESSKSRGRNVSVLHQVVKSPVTSPALTRSPSPSVVGPESCSPLHVSFDSLEPWEIIDHDEGPVTARPSADMAQKGNPKPRTGLKAPNKKRSVDSKHGKSVSEIRSKTPVSKTRPKTPRTPRTPSRKKPPPLRSIRDKLKWSPLKAKENRFVLVAAAAPPPAAASPPLGAEQQRAMRVEARKKAVELSRKNLSKKKEKLPAKVCPLCTQQLESGTVILVDGLSCHADCFVCQHCHEGFSDKSLYVIHAASQKFYHREHLPKDGDQQRKHKKKPEKATSAASTRGRPAPQAQEKEAVEVSRKKLSKRTKTKEQKGTNKNDSQSGQHLSGSAGSGEQRQDQSALDIADDLPSPKSGPAAADAGERVEGLDAAVQQVDIQKISAEFFTALEQSAAERKPGNDIWPWSKRRVDGQPAYTASSRLAWDKSQQPESKLQVQLLTQSSPGRDARLKRMASDWHDSLMEIVLGPGGSAQKAGPLLDWSERFMRQAKQDAQTILEEEAKELASEARTIPAASAGAPGIFVARGICYQLVTDPKEANVFRYGGNRPCLWSARKAAANQSKANNLLLSVLLDYPHPSQLGLVLPPHLLVQHLGRSLLACPAWPHCPLGLEKAPQDLGAVRLVHGATELGGPVVNSDAALDEFLQAAGEKLHLASHAVGGVTLHMAADATGYLLFPQQREDAPRATRLLLGLARTFPPEAAQLASHPGGWPVQRGGHGEYGAAMYSARPHLTVAMPAGLLCRVLRPELLARLKLGDPQLPRVSSDAFSPWGKADQTEQNEKAVQATRYLLQVAVPALASRLRQRQRQEAGPDLDLLVKQIWRQLGGQAEALDEALVQKVREGWLQDSLRMGRDGGRCYSWQTLCADLRQCGVMLEQETEAVLSKSYGSWKPRRLPAEEGAAGCGAEMLSSVFHEQGVPMRHLGLVRSLLPNAHQQLRDWLRDEAVTRALKHVVRGHLREAGVRPQDVPELLASFLNNCLGLAANSVRSDSQPATAPVSQAILKKRRASFAAPRTRCQKRPALDEVDNTSFPSPAVPCRFGESNQLAEAKRDPLASKVAQHAPGSSWSCPLCKFANLGQDAVCHMCLSPRHSPALASGPIDASDLTESKTSSPGQLPDSAESKATAALPATQPCESKTEVAVRKADGKEPAQCEVIAAPSKEVTQCEASPRPSQGSLPSGALPPAASHSDAAFLPKPSSTGFASLPSSARFTVSGTQPVVPKPTLLPSSASFSVSATQPVPRPTLQDKKRARRASFVWKALSSARAKMIGIAVKYPPKPSPPPKLPEEKSELPGSLATQPVQPLPIFPVAPPPEIDEQEANDKFCSTPDKKEIKQRARESSPGRPVSTPSATPNSKYEGMALSSPLKPRALSQSASHRISPLKLKSFLRGTNPESANMARMWARTNNTAVSAQLEVERLDAPDAPCLEPGSEEAQQIVLHVCKAASRLSQKATVADLARPPHTMGLWKHVVAEVIKRFGEGSLDEEERADLLGCLLKPRAGWGSPASFACFAPALLHILRAALAQAGVQLPLSLLAGKIEQLQQTGGCDPIQPEQLLSCVPQPRLSGFSLLLKPLRVLSYLQQATLLPYPEGHASVWRLVEHAFVLATELTRSDPADLRMARLAMGCDLLLAVRNAFLSPYLPDSPTQAAKMQQVLTALSALRTRYALPRTGSVLAVRDELLPGPICFSPSRWQDLCLLSQESAFLSLLDRVAGGFAMERALVGDEQAHFALWSDRLDEPLDVEKHTALQRAAGRAQVVLAARLLAKGSSLERRDAKGRTVLTLACLRPWQEGRARGEEEMLEMLRLLRDVRYEVDKIACERAYLQSNIDPPLSDAALDIIEEMRQRSPRTEQEHKHAPLQVHLEYYMQPRPSRFQPGEEEAQEMSLPETMLTADQGCSLFRMAMEQGHRGLTRLLLLLLSREADVAGAAQEEGDLTGVPADRLSVRAAANALQQWLMRLDKNDRPPLPAIGEQAEAEVTAAVAAAAGASRFGVSALSVLITAGTDSAADANQLLQSCLMAASRHTGRKPQAVEELAVVEETVWRGGPSPLHLAVKQCWLGMVEALVTAGASVNRVDGQGRTTIWWAAKQGDSAVLMSLLKGKDSREALDRPDLGGQTPLYIASGEGHADLVARLILARAAVHHRTQTQWQPLHHAIDRGHASVVHALLAGGTRSEMPVGEAQVAHPLVMACGKGYVEIVRALLVGGANPNRCFKGASPLYVASCNGHAGVVRLLLESKARASFVKQDGWTPLLVASVNGHSKVVSCLLKAGVDINQTRKDRASALYLASWKGHLSVVDILLSAGAQVDQAEKDGWSPLCIASQGGHLLVVSALLEAKARVNKTTREGWTALHSAASEGHAEVAELLISAGAKRFVRTAQGSSAAELALGGGHTELAAQLRKPRPGEPRLVVPIAPVAQTGRESGNV